MFKEVESPRDIPKELYKDYTLNGKIPVVDYFLNDTNLLICDGELRRKHDYEEFYTEENVNNLIEKVKNKEGLIYKKTDQYLYQALERYSIKNKTIVVIGSERPSYESIILAYGGKPFTIDYLKKRFGIPLKVEYYGENGKVVKVDIKKPIFPHPNLNFYTVEEFKLYNSIHMMKFDASFSISSIEHDGLGRYGDPLDPNADLKSMKELKNTIRKGGLLFLAVPIGKDILYWNAMRQYGKIRFPMLIEGWEIVDSFGVKDEDFEKVYEDHYEKGRIVSKDYHQPVFVLKNI